MTFSPAEQKRCPLQTTSSHHVFSPHPRYQKTKPLYLLLRLFPATRWPWSWKPTEGPAPRLVLACLPPAPPSAPTLQEVPYLKNPPHPCPVPWTWARLREGNSGTTHNLSWGARAVVSARLLSSPRPAPPPPVQKRLSRPHVTWKLLDELHSNLF